MIWDRFKGHAAQIAMFRRAVQRGRLAHGYLFVGASGIGKRTFARNVAQCLFCERYPNAELNACCECNSCRQVMADTHPDLLTVGCPPGKTILPISLIAGSAERRGREGLCYEISLRPMSANRRIAIIDDVQTLAAEGGNALLKTLEEPPANAIIILITTELDSVLSTIRSRCQPIHFAPLANPDVAHLLLDSAMVDSSEQAEIAAEHSQGSLTLAKELMEPGLLELRSGVHNSLKQWPINSLITLKRVNENLEALSGNAADQRRQARWVIQFLIDALREKLRQTPDRAVCDQLVAMVERCFLAERHLLASMSVPLCLEALFDELSQISRTKLGAH